MCFSAIFNWLVSKFVEIWWKYQVFFSDIYTIKANIIERKKKQTKLKNLTFSKA